MTRHTLPLLAATVLAATLAIPASPAPAAADEPDRTTTTAGTLTTDDHVELALTLSRLDSDGPVPMSVDGIVLATADRFPDAMAGAALADRDDTVLLFTGPDRLDPRVTAALDRLMHAKTTGHGHLRYGEVTVWLLGGPQALSDTVERQVASVHDRIRIVRLDGDTREHTALKVADEAIDLYDHERCTGDSYTAPNRTEWWWQHPPEPTCGHAQWRDMTRQDDHGNPIIHDNRYWPHDPAARIDVTIARGWGHPADVNGPSAWADSMTAASYLAPNGDTAASVVVLAAADGLDRRTRQWLADSPARHATLVGGPDALPGNVADQARSAGLKVRRIAGADRIGTSVALLTEHTDIRPNVHLPGPTWPRQDMLLVNGWADNGWGLALAAVNDGRPVLWALPHGLSPAHDGILAGCSGDQLLRPALVIGDRTLTWSTIIGSLSTRYPDGCTSRPWVADTLTRFPSCVTLQVYVNDDGLPSHARDGLRRAIDELNRHSAGTRLALAGSSHLRPDDAWGSRHEVRDTHGDHAVLVAAAHSWTAGSSQAFGGADSENGQRTVGSVSVRPNLSLAADAFAQLMLHELGHVVGLGHVPQHTGQTMRHWHDNRWEGLHAGDTDGIRWATSGPC